MLQHVANQNGIKRHSGKLAAPFILRQISTDSIFRVFLCYIKSFLFNLDNIHIAMELFFHIAGHIAGGTSAFQNDRAWFYLRQDFAKAIFHVQLFNDEIILHRSAPNKHLSVHSNVYCSSYFP